MSVAPVLAQSPIGIWKNIDDEDGKAKSHIEIYESGGKLHGKVIRLLDNATVTHCTACKDHRKDQPLIGMVIMKDLTPADQCWDSGKIFDPKKCKEYSCKIELSDANTLHVRGYIGSPLFGRTQAWYRVDDSRM